MCSQVLIVQLKGRRAIEGLNVLINEHTIVRVKGRLSSEARCREIGSVRLKSHVDNLYRKA